MKRQDNEYLMRLVVGGGESLDDTGKLVYTTQREREIALDLLLTRRDLGHEQAKFARVTEERESRSSQEILMLASQQRIGELLVKVVDELFDPTDIFSMVSQSMDPDEEDEDDEPPPKITKIDRDNPRGVKPIRPRKGPKGQGPGEAEDGPPEPTEGS